MTTAITFDTREEWLAHMAAALAAGPFKDAGVELNLDNVRMSVGWAKSRAKDISDALGACYSDAASTKAYREIFISPEVEDSLLVAGILAHELAHAALPFGTGHKAPFAKIVKAIGLEGKPKHAGSSLELLEGKFAAWAKPVIERAGPYPHAKMDLGGPGITAAGAPKKQATRMLKIECPSCRDEDTPYILRASRATLDRGLPSCPIHGLELEEAV
jgi:hypothetical protein